MTIQDVVVTVTQAVSDAFNLGVQSVTAGTFTQADVDAAVTKAKGDQKNAFLELVDAEDADLKAKAQAL